MYHFHVAPSVLKLPPVIPRVDEEPAQTGEVEVAAVGAVDKALTVTVVLAHPVVLQVPSALTQYVVVEAGLRTGAAPDVE